MSAALACLLQLASPALPVGAYSYSQGLEWACEAGTVRDEASAERWIGDVLAHSVASFEAPLLARLISAWQADDTAEAARLNAEFLASREAAELRAETLQMGHSLARLLAELDDPCAARLAALEAPPAFPTAWSCAATAWDIAPAEQVLAYLWCWLENQVMAALKLVPLGQSAGQRVLRRLAAGLPALAQGALELEPARWSSFAPGFALASARHETQYSRLFRS